MTSSNIKETQQQRKKSIRNIIPEGSVSCQESFKLIFYQSLLSLQYYETLTLLYETKFFQCVVLKQFIEKQESIFHLIEQNSRKRLLSAQKQPNNIGCNYIISKQQKPNKQEDFVGKLRGNFRNTQFLIYDGGQNPKKKSGKPMRKQLSSIEFLQDRIKILIPQTIQSNQSTSSCPKRFPKQMIPLQQKQNLLLQKSREKYGQILKLHSRPLQNQQKSDDCQEKMTIKIYQENKHTNNETLLIKKRSENTYRLDIGFPFNIIQGFGLFLAYFERNNQ